MVTSGMPAGISSTAAFAATTGAITTRPATPWSRCRSTASEMDRRSRLSTLLTLTAKPASAAARSTALSIEAGPNSVEFSVTTPIS
jgi:hypothetical protein